MQGLLPSVRGRDRVRLKSAPGPLCLVYRTSHTVAFLQQYDSEPLPCLNRALPTPHLPSPQNPRSLKLPPSLPSPSLPLPSLSRST